MKAFKLCLVAALALCLIAATPSIVKACFGTPVPPRCPQTVWLSKFCPETIVNPGTSSPINIPIGLIPYVSWDTDVELCAQPISAALEITIECTPAGGGAPVNLGPFAVPVQTPTVPGAQTINGVLGGPATITIPAGQVPAGSHVCVVRGTYTVDFGLGTGAGSVSGTGDTGLCIVEAAPGNPDLPRLEMRRLNLEDNGFAQCAKGDQSINYYFIGNNDPDESVSLMFFSDTNQVAVMPSGDNNDNTFFSIAGFDPMSMGMVDDPFYQAFADELNGGLIPDTDPHAPGTGEVARSFQLDPLEGTIVAVANRSAGMCTDGSCVEIRADVMGTFGDGTPAIGCANSATVVGDMAPKSPLNTTVDIVKTDGLTDALWSLAQFNNQPFFTTHAAGSNTNNDPGYTQTSGADIRMQFPSQAGDVTMSTDTLRSIETLNTVHYEMFGFRLNQAGMQDGLRFNMDVTITNLSAAKQTTMPLILAPDPLFTFFDFSSVIVNYNASTDDISVVSALDSGEDLSFNGTLTSLIESGGTGVSAVTSVCRQFLFDFASTAPFLAADPLAISGNFNVNGSDQTISADIVNGLDWQPVGWDGINTPNQIITPTPLSATAGTSLEIQVDVSALPLAPETHFSYVEVEKSVSVNQSVYIPVALRGFTGQAPAGIQPGADLWSTPLCGGQSMVDFSKNPIPADFFGPGSLPFEGIIELTADPIDDGTLGQTNIITRRTDTLMLNGMGSQDTVDIEILAMSLRSCEPITVTTGGVDSFFDVVVDLNPAGTSGGMMTVTQNSESGGNFDFNITADLRLAFTEVGNPSNTITFTGLEKGVSQTFSAENIPWSSSCDDQNIVRLNSETMVNSLTVPATNANFFAGVAAIPDTNPQECVCVYTVVQGNNASLGVITATATVGADTDDDGVPDDCDGCPDDPDPFQEDTDADTVNDACDNCPDEANADQADFNQDGMGDACSDSDNDGLTDKEELDMNLMPENPDSDNDGYFDGFEVDQGSNPDDNQDVPEPTGVDGDVNLDGTADASDLQFVINAALGLPVPFPTDVGGNGDPTDAVDVQTQINTLLGVK